MLLKFWRPHSCVEMMEYLKIFSVFESNDWVCQSAQTVSLSDHILKNNSLLTITLKINPFRRHPTTNNLF